MTNLEKELLSNEEILQVQHIQEILPHRYPFLLVDRILKMENRHKAVGIKNVTVNEPFFTGHFPGRPVMPGVLIVEAMAQVGGVVILSCPDFKTKVPYLTGIDKMRFRKPVIPGDQLSIEVELINMKGNIGKMKAQAKVEEQLVASGEILFAIMDT